MAPAQIWQGTPQSSSLLPGALCNLFVSASGRPVIQRKSKTQESWFPGPATARLPTGGYWQGQVNNK